MIQSPDRASPARGFCIGKKNGKPEKEEVWRRYTGAMEIFLGEGSFIFV